MEAAQTGPELVSEEIWAALRRDEADAVSGRFTETLRSALPPERFRAAWVRITASVGSLREWQLERPASPQQRTLVYRLSFEHARLLGQLAFDSGGEKLEGIHFAPQPEAAEQAR